MGRDFVVDVRERRRGEARRDFDVVQLVKQEADKISSGGTSAAARTLGSRSSACCVMWGSLIGDASILRRGAR